MRNVIARACSLMLLILAVNANEKLELKKDPTSNNEELKHLAETLLKGDSEKSVKPELGVLQKPILLKDAAKSQTQETPMKHMKLLPESENVSKHDSPRHKVTSANDNTHNEAVSPSLRNDSTLAPDNAINSTTVHTTLPTETQTNHQVTDAPLKKTIPDENNKNPSLNAGAHSKNNSKIPETPIEISAVISEEITIVPLEEITIVPIEEIAIVPIEEISVVPFEEKTAVPFEKDVTDIITSMLLGSTESGITDAYPEEVVEVVVVEEENIDDVADRPVSEIDPGLFTDPLIEEPLIEAITALENVELEITTISDNNSSWPLERFDFFVFNENSIVPCILMTMNLTLSITYEMKDQKTNTTEYQLPNELIVTGHCGSQNSSLTLSWTKSLIITQQNSITFNFVKDNSSFSVDSVQINVALDPQNFPNAKDAFMSGNSSANLKLFSAPMPNGIHVCSTETQVTCGKIVAHIHNATVIAYNENEDLSGRNEEYCHITYDIIEEVGVGSIIGGIIGVVIVVAIIATLCSWYRRRTDITLRTELP